MVDRNFEVDAGWVSDSVWQFEGLCRDAGLKVTPQRVCVYKALIRSKEHPSVDSVYREVKKEIRNVSFDTVNRTLQTLTDIDAAYVVGGSGDVKRFEGNLEDHQHFKCIKCKRIVDFHHEPFDNLELPAEVKGKFTVLRTSVLLEGLCGNCGIAATEK